MTLNERARVRARASRTLPSRQPPNSFWKHMIAPRQIARWPLYLWALPTTSLGLVCLAVGSAYGRIGTQVVDGVLELHGGLIEQFLRRGTLLPGGASAMTLGHVVLGRDRAALQRTRAHERVHVRQCERWGPLFVPAYLLSSLLLSLSGRDGYLDNPFEREAFDSVPMPQSALPGSHQMIRKR